MQLPAFKNALGRRFHGLALSYALVAYAAGLVGLFQSAWWVNLGALLLLAHGMIIAAYLIHECAHNTVFTRNADNARLGELLGWLCGSAYGTYEDIRFKHFRHHVDNDDVVWFDYAAFFETHPRLYRITWYLEWCYLPAHDLIMHFIMMFTSFVIPERRAQRTRNVAVLLLRTGLFFAMAAYSLKAALLYVLAYLMMMTVLRFMDSLQHDYGPTSYLFSDRPGPHKGDLHWEQAHTFSNMLAIRRVWPNWLVLNFGYHNAHHARSTTPWYQLPEVHAELYGEDETVSVPFLTQLKIFHRYRASRIMDEGLMLPDVYGPAFLAAARQGQVSGGNAASFLTSF